MKAVFKSCCLVAQFFQLFVTHWTVASQIPLSMGFLRQEILEWVVISYFRGFSQPRDHTCISCVSCIACGFLTCWAIGEGQFLNKCLSVKSLLVLSIYQATDAPNFLIDRSISVGLKRCYQVACCLTNLIHFIEPNCHTVPISHHSLINGCHLKDAGGHRDGAWGKTGWLRVLSGTRTQRTTWLTLKWMKS